MQISRRDALLGATAAAVITGAITAPLAIKAAAAKAALAGDPDAELLALCDRLDAALAAWTEISGKHSEARSGAERTIPLEQPWLVGRTPAEQARKEAIYHRHMEGHGLPALYREYCGLATECGDLSADVLHTRARTPGGIIRKLVLVPYGAEDDDLGAQWAVEHNEPDPVAFVVGSIRRDLERLSGGLPS